MKDSIKANLIIFFIIAIIAFGLSTSFAKMTITEDTDSYKLISIENNSFEPNYVDEVPTIIEKPAVNITNTTNSTYSDNTWNNTTQHNYTDYENTQDYNYTNSYSDNSKRSYSEQ